MLAQMYSILSLSYYFSLSIHLLYFIILLGQILDETLLFRSETKLEKSLSQNETESLLWWTTRYVCENLIKHISSRKLCKYCSYWNKMCCFCEIRHFKEVYCLLQRDKHISLHKKKTVHTENLECISRLIFYVFAFNDITEWRQMFQAPNRKALLRNDWGVGGWLGKGHSGSFWNDGKEKKTRHPQCNHTQQMVALLKSSLCHQSLFGVVLSPPQQRKKAKNELDIYTQPNNKH